MNAPDVTYEQFRDLLLYNQWESDMYKWLLVEAVPEEWCVKLLEEAAQ